jgi:hypothetical protein
MIGIESLPPLRSRENFAERLNPPSRMFHEPHDAHLEELLEMAIRGGVSTA